MPSCTTSLAKASGRSLTFVFTKGGNETSRLMNLINLPMDNSAVARKMTKDMGGSCNASSFGKASKPADVTLAVKAELAGISSLNIQLKPGELKRLRQSSGAKTNENDDCGGDGGDIEVQDRQKSSICNEIT